ncbi:MAG TPA: hypothetical protein DCW42_06235 [Bacteroidetes bacterium]|nr:hypothetical protein [Bacteroidota bacterium]
MKINHLKIHPKYLEEAEHISHRLRFYRNRIAHGDFDRKSFHRIYFDIKEFTYIFDKEMHYEDIDPELSMIIRVITERIGKIIDRLEHLDHF